MKNYLKLLKFLKGYEGRFGVAVVFIVLSSLFEGVQLTFILPVVDRIFENKPIVIPNKVPAVLAHLVNKLNAMDVHTLFWLTPLCFMVLFTIKQVVLFFSDYMMNDIAQGVMRDVRSRVFERMQTLSLDFFSRKRTGELISRITNDVGTIENAISYAVTDLVKQPVLIVVFMVISIMINTKGTIIVLLMFPLIGWPMVLINRKLRKIAKNTQEKMADINSLLMETISGVRILKAFGTEKYEIQRFRHQSHDYYKLRMKTFINMNMMGPITEMVGALCGMAILLILGNDVLGGHLSFGVFLLSIISITQVIRPIKRMANVMTIVQQALVANTRIYEVLETKPTVVERQDALELETFKSKITMEGVSFSYETDSGLVLSDIDLVLKKGELVAVVGPTGAGKSTLVNLIPRFYDAVKGRVLFDGTDVRGVSFKSLRGQVGIVTQEAILFNDTVRNNIAYGTFDVTLDGIQQAARMAFADRFIEKMPKGYDTFIGDRGFRLSGGEKQRLTIARAIVKNPPILILDEATSQLDSESEKYVQEALDKLMMGRTVIAIAHRLSTIMKADKIVVLEHGKIVGQGRHDDLLFSCPLYRRLYETQFRAA
ncbi:MAG: ABC transporter ATP-binding protein [Candidatus Omnitrophica bacterium]|nr:ABC transporter ATP-binding protein [Candidatus Omnitrophota bacterium]MDE2009092.1 ABC transporter ATP-binding protein [Candidatus Omnitrophota bacterium]MDE2214243.1 ABC transporter ATP-binding protein [Candidatus Omnitrophota bacterium]MDE2231280.1 ABC transporter ATP-binding protein [Candidatus Omnitrophota bacterium]